MAGRERRRGDAGDDPTADAHGPPGRRQEICAGAGVAAGTPAAGQIDRPTKERKDKGIAEKIMDCPHFKHHKWSARAVGAGSEEHIPESWRFSIERVQQLLAAA